MVVNYAGSSIGAIKRAYGFGDEQQEGPDEAMDDDDDVMLHRPLKPKKPCWIVLGPINFFHSLFQPYKLSLKPRRDYNLFHDSIFSFVVTMGW